MRLGKIDIPTDFSKGFKEIIIYIITNFICVLNIFFYEKEMFYSIFP